ncbi:MAG: HAMP domain-containing histidine kinase [Kofleriaceae bacterium]|nr:HAMP domain-containing histidine kinase [Kofleriaceae bacterium]
MESPLVLAANECSWSVATLHGAPEGVVVVSGSARSVFGVSADKLQEYGISALVVGAVPSPCPWEETCQSSMYLIRDESEEVRWVESRSILVDSKLLVSSRSVSMAGMSLEQFSVLGRLSLGGSLLGPLAHELNNIVQGLTSAEYLIRDSLQSEEAVDMEDVDQITLTLEALKRLGSELQGFARMSGRDVQPVDFPDTVKRVVRFLRAMGKLKTVEFELELPDGFPDMYWCRSDLEFILQALLCNAAEAPQLNNEAPRVRLAAKVIGDEVEIRVSNTSGDFDLARYQQPATSTKAGHRHTGIGLSAVVGILASCGGTIASAKQELPDQPMSGVCIRIPLHVAAQYP